MAFHVSDGMLDVAGRLFDPAAHDELLRSTVRLARLSFCASAASVFLYDPERDELVFEASSGEGEDRLLGVSIPSDHGIAGWVWNTGETIIVRDVDQDPRFDRSFAAGTGHVPNEIMAAPLEVDQESIGVLEVLDPRLGMFGDVTAIDMLTELAQQSCAALSLMLEARSLQPGFKQQVEREPLIRLEAALRRPSDADDTTINAFIVALTDLLVERR